MSNEVTLEDYCAGADCKCSADTCPLRYKFKWEIFNQGCKDRNKEYNGQLKDQAKCADILWYFAHEIEGLKETDLVCSIDGTTVILRPIHWLEETWTDVMDYVNSMEGEWIKDGNRSRWMFKADRIEYRIKEERWLEENRHVMEWWLQQPADVQERLIPESMDTAKWRIMDREARVTKIREVMKNEQVQAEG